MAGIVDISYGDLVDRFNAELCRQVFCDDGTGEPSTRLASAMRSGRRLADAVLLKAWSREQIEVLVTEDDGVRAAVLDLVMSEGMMGRLEWDGEGSIRSRLRAQGLETLRLLASSQTGSVGEVSAGTNPHSRAGSVRTNRPQGNFIFAPSRSRPIRGGF